MILFSLIGDTYIECDKTIRWEEVEMEKQEDVKEKMDTEVLEKMEIVGIGADRTGRMEKRWGDVESLSSSSLPFS